jgi:ABC-2 type transport system permease protein
LGLAVSILIGVGAVFFALGSFIGGFFGGMFGLRDASPVAIWLTWLIFTVAFLFFWLFGLITELQRSETINLQRLMHLPVALGQLFFINFLVSHFTLSIIVAVPAMLGLGLGLAIARGFEMLLLVPLAASMIFMISAWTYCFRGWLAQLMTNPRKRRTIIMCLTFAVILLGQGPNLYFNIFNRYHRHPGQMTPGAQAQLMDRLMAAQEYIPPLWLPCGARTLAVGNPVPALLGTLGCFAIGALGLRRTYRSTIRFYHGEIGGQAALKIKAPAERPSAGPKPQGRPGFLELNLPYVPEQAGALALATFRSLLRAPEVKLAWGASFIVPVIVSLGIIFKRASFFPDWAKPFAATGSTVFPLLLLIQFLSNQFGFDRDGFRSLMLSSAERRLILLGKNLACLPAALAPGLLLLAVVGVRLRLTPETVIATLFQLVTLFLIVGVVGNLVSILVPFRIAPGTLRPTKTKIEIVLLMMVLQMVLMTTFAPIFLPAFLEWLWRHAGWPDIVPVNLILSAAFCGTMVLIYWQTLGPLGRLLQRRETKILETITTEVE